MIAGSGVRDERTEPRLVPGSATATVTAWEKRKARSCGRIGDHRARRSASRRAFVHVTVLASVFVGNAWAMTAPPSEASTISEACATNVTKSMVATASGLENPSKAGGFE